MLIDCDTCRMRHTAVCSDCVVGVLIGSSPLDVDHAEQTALENLADAGLVPRLRLVSARGHKPPPSAAAG